MKASLPQKLGQALFRIFSFEFMTIKFDLKNNFLKKHLTGNYDL